jgi:hypothetical protein
MSGLFLFFGVQGIPNLTAGMIPFAGHHSLLCPVDALAVDKQLEMSGLREVELAPIE